MSIVSHPHIGDRFQFPHAPRSVLVVKKRGPGSDSVARSTGALVTWLVARRECVVWMEATEAEDMAKEHAALAPVRKPPKQQPAAGDRGKDATSSPGSPQASDTASHNFSSPHTPSTASSSGCQLPAGLYALSHPVLESEIAQIDFCVTLGGDGTVLALNGLLNSIHSPLPPVVSFGLGTLGFLTNLYFDEHQRVMDRVLHAYDKSAVAAKAGGKSGPHVGDKPATPSSAATSDPKHSEDHTTGCTRGGSVLPGRNLARVAAAESPSVPSSNWVMVNPRMRLFCRVYRRTSEKNPQVHDPSAPLFCGYACVGSYTCLNEVLVHRSASPFLAYIDVELIEAHAPNREPFYVTTVQGDGLMASTPTGSTAYSMAAGGPLMAPNASSFVLTPVSPHSLSFRPLILSADAEVRFVIAKHSRIGITERMVEGMVAVPPPPPPTPTPCACDGAEACVTPPHAAASPAAASAVSARRWAAVASMDGHYQFLLAPGDFVQFTSAVHPLRHFNLAFPRVSNEASWMEAITHKLHWNLTGAQLRLLEEQAKRGRRHKHKDGYTPHHPRDGRRRAGDEDEGDEQEDEHEHAYARRSPEESHSSSDEDGEPEHHTSPRARKLQARM